MAIFSENMMVLIDQGIRNLAGNLTLSERLTLSPDEFVTTFIDPAHVPILKQVSELVCGINGMPYKYTYLHSSDGYKVAAVLNFTEASPTLIPDYIANGFQPSADPKVAERVQDWIDQRVRVGKLFGDAYDAIVYLNHNVGNAAALKVMFPAIITILMACDIGQSQDLEPVTTKKAKQIQAAKSFGTIPKLPLEVKEHLMNVSSFITGSGMAEKSLDTSAAVRGSSLFAVTLGADINPMKPNIFTGGTGKFY